MTRLVDDRAQMTLSEVGRPTEAVADVERAAVKEGAPVEGAGPPGRQGADRSGDGHYEGPIEGTHDGTREEEGAVESGQRAGS